jgi:hypothetical protein
VATVRDVVLAVDRRLGAARTSCAAAWNSPWIVTQVARDSGRALFSPREAMRR